MSNYQAVITCRTTKGEEKTAATVYGAWAVHLRIAPRARDWSITHVPSGRAIGDAHTDLLTKTQALEVARRLDAKFGERQPRGKAEGQIVVEIIHQTLRDMSFWSVKP